MDNIERRVYDAILDARASEAEGWRAILQVIRGLRTQGAEWREVVAILEAIFRSYKPDEDVAGRSNM